jgi:DNA-binding CsgD family transcriptional regulator/5-methylcytosine-specific restriction endonuclease McrA
VSRVANYTIPDRSHRIVQPTEAKSRLADQDATGPSRFRSIKVTCEHLFVSSTRDRVAELLASGLSLAEVARRTGLAHATVSYHRDRLAQKRTPPASDVAEPPPLDRFPIPPRTRGAVHQLLEAGHSRAEAARLLGLTKATVTYHAGRLGMEIDARAARRYDWKVIQRYYDEGHSMQECRTRFGFSESAWSGAVARGEIVSRPLAMPIKQLLERARGRRNLKRRLIDAGLLATHCKHCGIQEWRGMPLSLQLHHVNGVRNDNRLENLALLCPNCHSQTKTFSGRNGRRKGGSGRPAFDPTDPAATLPARPGRSRQ